MKISKSDLDRTETVLKEDLNTAEDAMQDILKRELDIIRLAKLGLWYETLLKESSGAIQ